MRSLLRDGGEGGSRLLPLLDPEDAVQILHYIDSNRHEVGVRALVASNGFILVMQSVAPRKTE